MAGAAEGGSEPYHKAPPEDSDQHISSSTAWRGGASPESGFDPHSLVLSLAWNNRCKKLGKLAKMSSADVEGAEKVEELHLVMEE
uniref:Uncharacterized protein n=1 Tax=Oryza sativa subsp. japonica TaxID=39947 RepID=Q69JF1_ORYSJ|nr:hypothetical protein [Oryza sativa Japonica Group]BAD34377.1 hypothetical protein [Oryza sativa Japonica Group]